MTGSTTSSPLKKKSQVISLAHFHSAAFLGIDATLVEVEVDVKESEKFFLVIVGLPDAAVKESKDRVLTAIKNSGFDLKSCYFTVNLAPGDLKKEGPLYDLPIALGILQSHGYSIGKWQTDYLFAGELALSGKTRPIRGGLSLALLAKQLGKKGIVLPKANAEEASIVPGLEVIGIEDLSQACKWLSDPRSIKPSTPIERTPLSDDEYDSIVDFSEIKGQAHAKRALEIAAAGGHNLLLFGPPGSGKTLLAKAIIGILPPLLPDESIEVTKIYSIAGILKEKKGLVTLRPFRNPHHTISAVGLIGGGNALKPGEVCLAHRGVLFLDELPEFSRHALEVLRQPLENRTVTISRASGTITLPTSCLLLAAMNPCPCGFLGHPKKNCSDTSLQISRYRSKISGPLLDRIDMHVEVPAVPLNDLQKMGKEELSSTVRSRVLKARKKQGDRLGPLKTNASLTPVEISNFCPLDTGSSHLLRQVIESQNLSARGYHRLIKVARTIADLANEPEISEEHLMEALSFREIS